VRAFITAFLMAIPCLGHADAATERAVALVKEACLNPSSPEGQIQAAERLASTHNWKLDEKLSGRRRGLIATPEDLRRPDMFDGRHWEIVDPVIAGAFSVTIVTPEWVGWQQNGCVIFSRALPLEQIVAEARRQLGLGEAVPFAGYSHAWFLEKVAGKISDGTRAIVAGRQRLRSGDATILGVINLKAPDDGAMPPPLQK
jgi:hypothetical protein